MFSIQERGAGTIMVAANLEWPPFSRKYIVLLALPYWNTGRYSAWNDPEKSAPKKIPKNWSSKQS
jgi:hypothetical protein